MEYTTTTTILELVVLAAWTCLCRTPSHHKNTLHAQFFPTHEALDTIAKAASIVFAPGLFEVLTSVTPPTIQFFKSLPRTHRDGKHWGIYLLVFEHTHHQPKVYIGSGTSTSGGVGARLKQYDDGFLLPRYVEATLHEGYHITHKGLLCWTPTPSATQVPINRLLFFALEATLAFMFWTMRQRTGYHGLTDLCLWDHDTLEYIGLCSHSALYEGILGDFDLTPEELETQAAEREKKRIALKAENATNHHYKQMVENYDEYITDANDRVYRSRANNPGRDATHQARRIKDALQTGTFHCTICNITFGTKQRLHGHEQTAKHRRKLSEVESLYKCILCNLGFHNKSNLTRHNKTERHRRAVEAASSGDTRTTSAGSSTSSIIHINTAVASRVSMLDSHGFAPHHDQASPASMLASHDFVTHHDKTPSSASVITSGSVPHHDMVASPTSVVTGSDPHHNKTASSASAVTSGSVLHHDKAASSASVVGSHGFVPHHEMAASPTSVVTGFVQYHEMAASPASVVISHGSVAHHEMAAPPTSVVTGFVPHHEMAASPASAKPTPRAPARRPKALHHKQTRLDHWFTH